ncbi:M23 family peptidase [Brachybacterium alimentarium]|uniref:M23 family metallopeptidase n=1 Tax=Brachybacterium alimentarium TaxID=47845 RepID=UPI000DF149FF|nr:M23 family metallopeptidase [Brachybacterium alimentarium]RCS71146.1 M23 family peptidase [Brachybacterium alimentarium]
MTGMVLSLYRVRGPFFYAAMLIIFAAILSDLLGDVVTMGRALQDGIREVQATLVPLAFAVALACVVLTFVAPRWLSVPEARVVGSPVRGRWMGINSPASAVPSHGVRAYGQAYAIDLVHDPLDVPRPEFGGPAMRAAEEYPAFGRPVHAMLDGTVVRVSDRHRDHRARSNRWGVAWMMLESVIREIGGPGFVVGNHVTIRGDDGVCAMVAHLQRGSVLVQVGERVRAGEQIGSCGNTGNSSEPHVHAQLMDRASCWTGQGLPMAFADVELGAPPELDIAPGSDDASEVGDASGADVASEAASEVGGASGSGVVPREGVGAECVDGLPENGQHMTVPIENAAEPR